jgi:hypothetical protein
VFAAFGVVRKEASTLCAQRDLATASCPTPGMATTVELGSVRAAMGRLPLVGLDSLQPLVDLSQPCAAIVLLQPCQLVGYLLHPCNHGVVLQIVFAQTIEPTA